MLTDLTVAEITDETGTARKLTPGESTTFANLIISAGTETVARLLGNFAVVLAAQPGSARRARRRCRARSPTRSKSCCGSRRRRRCRAGGRRATSSSTVEIVPANSKVLLLTGAAGRDERKYPDADRFDIHRTIDHHVAFGYGIHFCLGAALARLEGRIGIEETLRRFPTWEVDHDRVVRLHTSTVRGYSQVPIDVHAA